MQENVIFWQKLWCYISLDYHSCFAMACQQADLYRTTHPWHRLHQFRIKRRCVNCRKGAYLWETLLEVHQMLEEKPEPEILADASIHSTLRQMHEQLAKLDTALREFRLSKLQEQIASLRANIARITG